MTAFDVDRAAAGLARSQHGAFNRQQLVAAGGSAKIIRARLARGLWVQLAPDVFALASHPGTWKRQLIAAVLGERRAVVFGRAAAALHGVSSFRPGHLDILVPRGAAHRSTLASVHESDAFQSTVVDHIPVLTLPDTFVALAGLVPGGRLAAAFEVALLERSLEIGDMQRRYLDFVGSRRPGLRRLASLIDDFSAQEPALPESVLERLLYGILRRPGMPLFRAQAPLPWAPGQRADAMLVDAPVILEADGRRWHARVADFERDRCRDRLAAAHGHQTLRSAARELAEAPDAVAREIRAVHLRLRTFASLR